MTTNLALANKQESTDDQPATSSLMVFSEHLFFATEATQLMAMNAYLTLLEKRLKLEVELAGGGILPDEVKFGHAINLISRPLGIYINKAFDAPNQPEEDFIPVLKKHLSRASVINEHAVEELKASEKGEAVATKRISGLVADNLARLVEEWNSRGGKTIEQWVRRPDGVFGDGYWISHADVGPYLNKKAFHKAWAAMAGEDFRSELFGADVIRKTAAELKQAATELNKLPDDQQDERESLAKRLELLSYRVADAALFSLVVHRADATKEVMQECAEALIVASNTCKASDTIRENKEMVQAFVKDVPSLGLAVYLVNQHENAIRRSR